MNEVVFGFYYDMLRIKTLIKFDKINNCWLHYSCSLDGWHLASFSLSKRYLDFIEKYGEK